MKAIFGILSLVIVLAIVGSIAKKQLSASSGLAGRAAAADRAASLAVDSGVAADATVPQQAKALEEQARERTVRALQQGVDRNNRADP
ncbi:MAG: hypothetical protein ABI364_04035 [Caldimonas sp.]